MVWLIPNFSNKTTSILLIDGKKYGTDLDANNVRQASSTGDTINYYIGVRNIDMLLKGYGRVGMEDGSLNLNIHLQCCGV